MKVAIYTLGCRLNFAETEELAELLKKKHYEVSSEKPQIIIIRGCSVTQKAEKETRAKIYRLKRREKNALIIAAGCLGNNFHCPSADLIFFKKNEEKLLKKLKNLKTQPRTTLGSGLPGTLGGARQKPRAPVSLLKFRTRAFIKIQDGCKNYCAYCLVPFLRGRERSKSANEIIEKIKEREKNGYQEIVLTGVNIGRWQNKLKTKNEKIKTADLTWLIKEILDRTNIPRIRISSLWPDALDEKLAALFKNQELCQHIHLSLQSLCQSVLQRMKRPYQVKEIIRRIKNFKKKFSDLTVSADIIVGFPGETEKEFKETISNVKKIGLAKIHVFRYSPRPGTAAALMKNQIKEKIKKKRAKRLFLLNNQLNQKWRQKFIGQIKKVLFEQKKDDFWRGLTDNYLRVYLKNKGDLANKIISIKLVKIYQDGLLGKIY